MIKDTNQGANAKYQARRKRKLDDESVRFIRSHPEMTSEDCGRKFGVTGAAVSQMRRGYTYRDVK